MIDIEQAIIGLCFKPENVVDIISQFSVADFQIQTNQQVFSAIEKLTAKNITPDIISIAAECEASPAYIADIQENYEFGNIKQLSEKFRVYADRNKYLKLSRELPTLEDPQDMLKAIEQATSNKQTSTAEHASVPLKRALNSMESAFNNRGQITGVPTGLQKIDEELSGLHKTDMILVAARPSIGKTALALQIAEHACIDKNIPTLFISLEMSSDQLISSMLLSRILATTSWGI